MSTDEEALAMRFHEAYERLAPQYGYATREASAKPWAEVPAANRELMTAVCRELLPSDADLRGLLTVHALVSANQAADLARALLDARQALSDRDARIRELEAQVAALTPPEGTELWRMDTSSRIEFPPGPQGAPARIPEGVLNDPSSGSADEH